MRGGYQAINEDNENVALIQENDVPEPHSFPEKRVKACSFLAAALCVLQPVQDFAALSVTNAIAGNAVAGNVVFGGSPVELLFDMVAFVIGLHGVINLVYFPSLLYAIFSLGRAAQLAMFAAPALAAAMSPGSSVALDGSLSLGVPAVVGLLPLAVVVAELRHARLREANDAERSAMAVLDGGVVVASMASMCNLRSFASAGPDSGPVWAALWAFYLLIQLFGLVSAVYIKSFRFYVSATVLWTVGGIVHLVMVGDVLTDVLLHLLPDAVAAAAGITLVWRLHTTPEPITVAWLRSYGRLEVVEEESIEPLTEFVYFPAMKSQSDILRAQFRASPRTNLFVRWLAAGLTLVQLTYWVMMFLMNRNVVLLLSDLLATVLAVYGLVKAQKRWLMILATSYSVAKLTMYVNAVCTGYSMSVLTTTTSIMFYIVMGLCAIASFLAAILADTDGSLLLFHRGTLNDFLDACLGVNLYVQLLYAFELAGTASGAGVSDIGLQPAPYEYVATMVGMTLIGIVGLVQKHRPCLAAYFFWSFLQVGFAMEQMVTAGADVTHTELLVVAVTGIVLSIAVDIRKRHL